MISCPSVSKRVIRNHYDVSTLFYRLFWGPHIHHGFWEGQESPAEAAVQLTERLADMAGIQCGQRVLDIGCGMGGSTIHLARTRNCSGVGVTISRVQQCWASASAKLQRVGSRVAFRQADAEQIDFPEGQADVVWSVECTEHLFDKPAFFAKAARWLRPGGRMAICAWLAGSDMSDEQKRQQVYDVCEGFFCPSLGAASDYVHWMESAGLRVDVVQDWTSQVARTWEICRDRVQRSGVQRFAKWIDRDTSMFLDRFDTLLQAYRSGAMEYGCFVAVRPNENSDK